jgi:hypothetical protein
MKHSEAYYAFSGCTGESGNTPRGNYTLIPQSKLLENTLRSHSVVSAVTHPEGESPNAIVRTNTNNSTRTMKQSGSSNLENHDELDDPIEEIAINYAESGELYNRKNTIVDINFVSNFIQGKVPEALRLGQMERSNRDGIALAF